MFLSPLRRLLVVGHCLVGMRRGQLVSSASKSVEERGKDPKEKAASSTPSTPTGPGLSPGMNKSGAVRGKTSGSAPGPGPGSMRRANRPPLKLITAADKTALSPTAVLASAPVAKVSAPGGRAT